MCRTKDPELHNTRKKRGTIAGDLLADKTITTVFSTITKEQSNGNPTAQQMVNFTFYKCNVNSRLLQITITDNVD